MKIIFYFVVLLLLELQSCQSQEDERTILDNFSPALRVFRESLGVSLKTFLESRENRQLLKSRHKAAEKYIGKFPCDLNITRRSTFVPKTAHNVRPGDIDVVAAIGDSLTAGVGISASFFLLESFEDRGKSFAIGGQDTWRTYLTIPNILKEFNPNLIGYSLGASITNQKDSQFNLAELGAISSNMPYMAKVLVKRIREDPRVDMKKHWKMITLMVGDNDFCSEICYYENPYDVLEKHRLDMIRVLRIFKDNLPRTIVNIVPAPNLRVFARMTDLSPFCVLAHSFFCPCIDGLVFRPKRNVFFDIMDKWQQIDIEVANMPEFDKDNFTVIPHLFTTNYTFPTTLQGSIDYGYLAADCFHFSERGHARFANDLWNSLLEPFGNKSTDGADIFSKFHCPTEDHPYIFTKRNSQ